MGEGRAQGAGRPPRGTTPVGCKGVFREHPGAAAFLRRQPFTHSPGLSQRALDLSTDLRHKFLAYSFAPPSQGLGASPAHSLCPLSLQSCQADLVKDNGHKYFLSVLADPYMPVRAGRRPPRAAPGSAPGVPARMPCRCAFRKVQIRLLLTTHPFKHRGCSGVWPGCGRPCAHCPHPWNALFTQ